MPTQVHHLAPAVRKSIPLPKPPAPQPSDTFEQRLNDARSKPEPKPEPKTEAKKPTPASKPTKPKPANGQNAEPEAIVAEAPADSAEPSPTNAKPIATTEDATETETPDDTADPETAPDADAPEATPTDAQLAQLAAAALPAQPVAQPNAEVDADAAPDAESEEEAPVPNAVRVSPTGTPSPSDQDEDALPSQTDLPAAPHEQFAGGFADQPGAEDQNPNPDLPAAQTPKKSTPTVSALGADPEAPVAPRETAAPKSDPTTTPTDAALAAQDLHLAETAAKADAPATPTADALTNPAGLAQAADVPAPAVKTQANAAPLPPVPPEVRFADDNHEQIVTSVRTQLLPQGNGSMQIRLDPPELGALKVSIEMANGQMTATFQTSNEEATKLLSHSLNQLKHVLESQGVTVDRLQVQQAPKSDNQPNSGNPEDGSRQGRQDHADDHASRQEQQRKEALQRMWRKVSGVSDPIDYLA